MRPTNDLPQQVIHNTNLGLLNFDYRRQWVKRTEQLLARLFAVEVAFHSELSNHIHVILRTRPDVVTNWSDEEVVRRWLSVAKLKRNGAEDLVEPSQKEIERELREPGRVAELRRRLADVSWFMGALCENIARRCNRDSDTSGAFWEHRFGCRSLVSEAAILLCGIYVDLNLIRAGEAESPEESRHTSAYDRIQSFQQRIRSNFGQMPANFGRPDRWLCELTLQPDLPPCGEVSQSPWRASNKGILSISLQKYLDLLDWSGRQLLTPNRCAIPAKLAPIFERLKISQSLWLEAVDSFDQWFGRVVGSVEALRNTERRVGHAFFGSRKCMDVFG